MNSTPPGSTGAPAPEIIEYHPSPTLASFHADNSFGRGVMGPLGSGKSSAMCIEILRRSCQQEPYNGVRRTRWAVIRNTSSELRTTTIKTWREWIPERVCPIRWSPPLTAHMEGFVLPDGTTVDMEVIFEPLDTEKDIRHLLSLELTGAWVNEAREVPKIIIDELTGRVFRYPPKRSGGATWGGVIMDTNPPSTRHWWYRLAEDLRPPGWQFWKQPGGLLRLPDGSYIPNPSAENVKHQTLGYQYWLNMIPGKDSSWIDVRVLGEYGTAFEGQPVYSTLWQDSVHVSREPLQIHPGLPVFLGWDFGLCPACVALQLSPKGKLYVLREWLCERGGLRQFVTEVVRPALLQEFPGMTVISRCDPAGSQSSQVDESTCIGELNRLGIPTEPASTQDLVIRRDAVNFWLTRMIEGQPAFQLDPGCGMLRDGFNGGYHFAKARSTGLDTYRDTPEKNEYSHIHEALQYIAMHLSAEFTARVGGLGRGAPPIRQVSSWAGSV